MSSKGRTELQISLSRAKNVEEVAGDIRFCVFLQKTGENTETPIFSSNKFVVFRKCPKASECIEVQPNVSKRICTRPNVSEQPNASKNFEKLWNLKKSILASLMRQWCFDLNSSFWLILELIFCKMEAKYNLKPPGFNLKPYLKILFFIIFCIFDPVTWPRWAEYCIKNESVRAENKMAESFSIY